MAVITLSWQYGCLGGIIAADAAEQLGYTLVGKTTINEMLAALTGESSQELKTNNDLVTAEEELEDGLFQRLQRQQATYTNLLISSIYQAASQDHTIIKGYGAQRFLYKYPHVFCVRLKGSFDVRVAMIQQHKQITQQEAEALVKKEDRERMEFMQYVFKRELTDVKWYDMVIDIGKVGLQYITKMITSAARTLDETHLMAASEKAALHNLSLTHRIKGCIQKRTPGIEEFAIDVESGGIVKISGIVKNEEEKAIIPQHIEGWPEVQKIVNLLRVVAPIRQGPLA